MVSDQWRISEPDALENQTIENVGKPGTYLSLISGGSIVDSTLLQGNPNEFRWAIRRDEQFGDKWRMFVPNTCHNVDLSDNGNANVRSSFSRLTPGRRRR